MSAADGDGFVERPTFARARSLVSLAAESATPMENGGCHVPRSVSNRNAFEPDAWPGDSTLALCPRQRRFQRLDGRVAHLACHAAGHARVGRLAALRRKENFSMNSNVSPDLIVHNGRITTLDPKCPEATNLAVKNGRIVGVNDAEEYQPEAHTKVIDLEGRRVIPGLNDSHLHVIRGGLNYNLELRWDGVPSLADGLRMLKQQAERTPPGQWVRVVGGWS